MDHRGFLKGLAAIEVIWVWKLSYALRCISWVVDIGALTQGWESRCGVGPSAYMGFTSVESTVGAGCPQLICLAYYASKKNSAHLQENLTHIWKNSAHLWDGAPHESEKTLPNSRNILYIFENNFFNLFLLVELKFELWSGWSLRPATCSIYGP
jgi:hypothetical protein